MDSGLESLLAKIDPKEVVVVRPDSSWAELIGRLIGLILGFFIRVGLVSWAATHISFIPDWGYFESLFIVLIAGWIFHRPTEYTYWTKSWDKRAGAVRDLFSKGRKR